MALSAKSRSRLMLTLRWAYPGILGAGLPVLPPGYVFLTDDDGVYLTDDNGVYLLGEWA